MQEILGHSDITITLSIYSHVMRETKMAAVRKLNHFFENKNSSHKEGTNDLIFINFNDVAVFSLIAVLHQPLLPFILLYGTVGHRIPKAIN